MAQAGRLDRAMLDALKVIRRAIGGHAGAVARARELDRKI
jgi:hypothetical protein